jgi:hypothetical protein
MAMMRSAKVLVGMALIGLCFGPLACKKESAAKSVGGAVGEAVTDFGKGVAKGVDRRMEAKVQLTDGLKKAGLSCTTAKLSLDGPNDAVTVNAYLLCAKRVKGDVMAKAINEAGNEIGRATAPIDLPADGAQYVNFTFPREMDSQMVDHYLLCEVKSAAIEERL